MEADKTGLQYPAGLAFSSRAIAFYVVEGPGQSPPAATDVIKLTPFANRIGSARIAAQIKDPINMAFDNKVHRLLILQFTDNQLLEVREGPDGNLDPTTLIRYDARRFGLQNPQGITVDPASGYLFILDAVGPRIVRVEPGLDGSFDGALISEVNLQPSGLVAPRGLAFDPTTSHLYFVSPVEQKLYELTQTGQVVDYRDLSEFRLGNPQGMVFAPSGDQTDDPSQVSLYLADSGPVSGQILEFSLVQPAARAAAAASSFQSSLVRTTNTDTFSPPSPDPDGLTYLPLSNTLLMSDSEVEETVSGITHFAGANLWEMTLNGSVVRTANISTIAPTVVPMTDEPTGVAWSSATGHFFFSDDDAYMVWDLNPGPDGQIGTVDDSWTSFDTLALGIGDPEGITYDEWHNQLFVVDGTNQEIYQFTVTGSPVGHFDVAAYGVVDPEGIEFNPDSGTLFVLSSSANPVIIETTISGTLLQTIDVSANNAEAPAGLAYAPASDGSGTKHFYIVDRGVDNNTNPNISDGKMYEMSASSSGTPTVTNTPTMTATRTFTPTATNTPTATATMTYTSSRTNTPSVTNTPTMTATRTSTYSQNQYTLTIISDHGTVNRDIPGPYHYGDVVQLTTVPDAGWSFGNWSGDATGTTNPVSVTMNGNKTVTAHYTQNQYTLTVTSLHGTVAKSPDKATYTYGEVVQLTATPDTDWSFGSWSANVTGGNVTINGNTTVTATFTQNEAPVANAQSVTTAEDTAKAITLTGSDADGDPLTYSVVAGPSHGTLSGTAPALTYTPAANYNGSDSFTFKVNDGTVDSAPATVSITVTAVNNAPIITEGASINISMSEDGSTSPFSLTLHATDVDGDTLTWSILTPAGHGTASASGAGTSKAITYTPALHYIGSDSFVVQVSDGHGGTDTITVHVTITAVEPPSFTMTIISDHGTVNRNIPGPYHYGDVVQLTVVPDAGWSFANWSGDATGTTNPISVTMNGNKTVTANYTQNHYTLMIPLIMVHGSGYTPAPSQTGIFTDVPVARK